jgi:excisionase family DNA binding protein
MAVENKELTITVEEAGRRLGIARALAYRLAANGQIPVLRLGRKLRVPVPALMRLLEATSSTKESH